MRKLINVALDVDDVLMMCNHYAVRLINLEGCNPPMELSEIYQWGKRNDRSDKVYEYYNMESFWKTQPVYAGAHEFVRELSKMANIFITSAVAPKFMSIRAERIMQEFPEIPPENIILGARKDMYNFDICLDDGGHNILDSKATYPILLRRPWNKELTGLLSVNNLNEALNLIKEIINPESINPKRANIIALVGPSGSGKNALIEAVSDKFDRIRGCSTSGSINYDSVSERQFDTMITNGEMFEYTRYGGHYYGTRVDQLLLSTNNKKRLITAVDICGAMALKKYCSNVSIVYIDTDKISAIKALLKKGISDNEKALRIASLDHEKKNRELCDAVLRNTGNLEELKEQFLQIAL